MANSDSQMLAADKRIHITIKDKGVRDALALIPKSNRGSFVERALRVFLSTKEGQDIFQFLRKDRNDEEPIQAIPCVAAPVISTPLPLAAPVHPASVVVERTSQPMPTRPTPTPKVPSAAEPPRPPNSPAKSGAPSDVLGDFG